MNDKVKILISLYFDNGTANKIIYAEIVITAAH